MKSFDNYLKPLPWLVATGLTVVLAACGGGGDGGGGAKPAPQAAAIGNINGDWTITETDIQSTASQCVPPSNPLATYPVTVAQTGTSSSLTVTDSTNPSSGPVTFTGSLHGPTLSWSGSFPERGGTTTWNSVNLAVASDCNTATGTYSWTYVQDPPTVFSCTATTKLTAARNNPTGCTAPVPPSST